MLIYFRCVLKFWLYFTLKDTDSSLGTTGTPKGCDITHENAVQAILAFQRIFVGRWDSESRWLQFASYHFDVSVLEQFWSWSVGIAVTSAPRDLILEDIPEIIRQLRITHIDLTPSLARTLRPDNVPSLWKGVFITGGELLKQEILDEWGPKACIYNLYLVPILYQVIEYTNIVAATDLLKLQSG